MTPTRATFGTHTQPSAAIDTGSSKRIRKVKEAISILIAQTRLQTSARRVRDRVGARVTSFHVILLFALFVTYRNSDHLFCYFIQFFPNFRLSLDGACHSRQSAPAPPKFVDLSSCESIPGLRLISLVADENGMLNELALKIDAALPDNEVLCGHQKSREYV